MNIMYLFKCASKELTVMGDISCGVMKSLPDAHAQQFNFLSSLCHLDQLINKHTREAKKSSTLVDLVLTNIKENILAFRCYTSETSDHSLVYAVRKFIISKHKPAERS